VGAPHPPIHITAAGRSVRWFIYPFPFSLPNTSLPASSAKPFWGRSLPIEVKLECGLGTSNTTCDAKTNLSKQGFDDDSTGEHNIGLKLTATTKYRDQDIGAPALGFSRSTYSQMLANSFDLISFDWNRGTIDSILPQHQPTRIESTSTFSIA
jgi:hypothetical protein